MKYLFIVPRCVASSEDPYTFPFGIAYVSAAFKKANLATFALNLNHSDEPIKDQIQMR